MVRGSLYAFSSGIPVLQVMEKNILAYGTVDPIAYIATQVCLFGHLVSYIEPTPKIATVVDWGPMYGEFLAFDDPFRLPAID